jgi:hypothetical protein
MYLCVCVRFLTLMVDWKVRGSTPQRVACLCSFVCNRRKQERERRREERQKEGVRETQGASEKEGQGIHQRHLYRFSKLQKCPGFLTALCHYYPATNQVMLKYDEWSCQLKEERHATHQRHAHPDGHTTPTHTNTQNSLRIRTSDLSVNR